MSSNEYRISPNYDGRWILEKYHPEIDLWLCEAHCNTPEDADEAIKQLSRDIQYYRHD